MLRFSGRRIVVLAVNVLALALLMVGGGFVNLQRVFAGSNSYSETWTATQFRNFPQVNPVLSIGPAQWMVTGANGATSWKETWNVTKWSGDSCIALYGGSYCYSTGVTGAYITPPFSYYYSSSIPTSCVSTQTSYYLSANICSAGLYGAMITSGVAGSATATTATSADWPLSWQVSGTITTP